MPTPDTPSGDRGGAASPGQDARSGASTRFRGTGDFIGAANPGPATHLLALMRTAGVSARARLGPEDRMAIGFANSLRAATLEGRLLAVWVHPANELAGAARATVRAAIAKALGLMPGAADFLFLHATGALALEAKAPGGRQSPSQKHFQAWCVDQGVPYHLFRSEAEGLALLRAAGILS